MKTESNIWSKSVQLQWNNGVLEQLHTSNTGEQKWVSVPSISPEEKEEPVKDGFEKWLKGTIDIFEQQAHSQKSVDDRAILFNAAFHYKNTLKAYCQFHLEPVKKVVSDEMIGRLFEKTVSARIAYVRGKDDFVVIEGKEQFIKELRSLLAIEPENKTEIAINIQELCDKMWNEYSKWRNGSGQSGWYNMDETFFRAFFLRYLISSCNFRKTSETLSQQGENKEGENA